MENTENSDLRKWPGGCRAAISLCYDSGYQSQVDFALPDLERTRIRSTFLLDGELYLKNSSDWKKALRTGHEIGNGSLLPWAEEDGNLTNWLIETALDEISQTDHLLREALEVSSPILGLPKGRALCRDGSMIEQTAGRLRRMNTEYIGQSENELDVFPIFCYGMTYAELQAVTFEAARNERWAVLCFSEISQVNIGAPNEPTSPEDHHNFTKWLIEQDYLWLAPISDVLAFRQAMSSSLQQESLTDIVLDR